MKIFAITILSLFTWSASLYLLLDTKEFVFNTIVLNSGLISSFVLVKLIEIYSFKKINFYLLKFLTLLSVFLVLNGLVVLEINIINDLIHPVRGLGYPFFAITIFINIVYIITLVFDAYKNSNPIQKNKLFYFLLGIFIMVTTSLFSNLILPWFGNNNFQFLGPISVLVFLLLSGYSIFVKNILDIKIVIQKSLIYVVIFTLITLLYLTILILSTTFFENSNISITANIIVIFIALKTIPSIDTWLRKISDKWLHSKKTDPNEFLERLSKELVSIEELDSFIIKTTSKLKELLKVEEVSFSVANKNTSEIISDPIFLQKNKKIYVPVISTRTFLGTLYVGHKKSGAAFSYEDAYLLKTFSYHASSKLKQLQLISELKQHSKDLEKSLEYSQDEVIQLQQDQHQMVTDIAHNLQTPLTVLRGEIDTLKKVQNSLSIHDVNSMNKHVDRLSQFITKLIQVSDNRKNEYQLKKVLLSEYVQELCEYFNTIAESQGISFTYDIQDEVYAYIDSYYFKDVIQNVVANAFKYRKRKAVSEVHLKLYESSVHIHIEIKDNGIGIKEESIKYIFNRWYQADVQKKGSGLGLAIAKNIIQKHRGLINITSVKDKGTEVLIELPKEKPQD